jgi:hypothetical protein
LRAFASKIRAAVRTNVTPASHFIRQEYTLKSECEG